MRLLLAVTIAVGVAFAPAALAKEARSVASKHKTHRTAKVHKTSRNMPPPSGPMNANRHPYGEPYTMQKDEMTR